MHNMSCRKVSWDLVKLLKNEIRSNQENEQWLYFTFPLWDWITHVRTHIRSWWETPVDRYIRVFEGILQSWCSCRSWLCRWGRSSSGSPGTRLASGCTGGLCSWASRRSPRCRFPPRQSCSGSGRRGSRRSLCHTRICDPCSHGPRRRWSGWKFHG